MAGKNVLVLGASLKPQRYSNMAIRSLLKHGHPVLAVGLRSGQVEGVELMTELPEGANAHTVTLYLNATNQLLWMDRILALSPERIIFNPGAENAELYERAQEQGIQVLNACTLVMLSTDQF